MSAAHTAGPWVVSKRASRRVANSFGVVICNAILRNAGSFKNGAKLCGAKHDEEAEANARLIAAAPELLAALQGIAPTLKAQIAAGMRWDPTEVDAVFAAIAKATGDNL